VPRTSGTRFVRKAPFCVKRTLGPASMIVPLRELFGQEPSGQSSLRAVVYTFWLLTVEETIAIRLARGPAGGDTPTDLLIRLLVARSLDLPRDKRPFFKSQLYEGTEDSRIRSKHVPER